MSGLIKVALPPIAVPAGKWCWNWVEPKGRICPHFDNSEWIRCEQHIGRPIRDGDNGYLKPKECLALKEVES